jgi:hypothetical protein
MSEDTKATADATKAVAESTGKLIDAGREAGGFVAQFIAPPLREISGIVTDNLKFRRWENAMAIDSKVRQRVQLLGPSYRARQLSMDVGIPLIEACSLAEGEDVRELWANLIVNLSNEASRTAPDKSFAAVLKEFNPLDVRIFQTVYQSPESDSHCILTEKLPDQLEFMQPRKEGEPITTPNSPPPAVQLSLANLFRLQCLQTAKYMGGPDVYYSIYSTPFGRALYDACSQ